jgi:hypothetical protein
MPDEHPDANAETPSITRLEAAGAAAGYGAGVRIFERGPGGSGGRRRASDAGGGSVGSACAGEWECPAVYH